MDIIRTLLSSVQLPSVMRIEQYSSTPAIASTADAVHATLTETGVLASIAPGATVAIAVGSRGIADLPILARELIHGVKSVGGRPFIFPAMGSHGGATAEGQADILAELGVTETQVGAPIISSMETLQLGTLDDGTPVYVDKAASVADHVIVIARVKPHTAFRGPYESGLAKMLSIGVGKQRGADAAHALGFGYMADRVPAIARIVLDKWPVLFGLAVIENAEDRPAEILAVPAQDIMAREPALLQRAKQLMPRLPFDHLDVLVIDQIGKDISGDGMDPNITGRYASPFASGGPAITRIAVLGLTAKTHGNANGIGMADVTTRLVMEQIDHAAGFANALTSTVPECVRIPMFLDTPELAVKAAVKMANVPNHRSVRLARIRNTLALHEMWISPALQEEALAQPHVTATSGFGPMQFDDGNILS